jgi:hypothetical protein
VKKTMTLPSAERLTATTSFRTDGGRAPCLETIIREQHMLWRRGVSTSVREAVGGGEVGRSLGRTREKELDKER